MLCLIGSRLKVAWEWLTYGQDILQCTLVLKISDELLQVQDWIKFVMEERREVLGDKFICMLQLDEGGVLHMFYVILPKREQQEWLAS